MTGPRILIVEDETTVAMLLEAYLEELGCTVVAIATNVQQAIRLATEEVFDLAFLDVNLNGQRAHALPGVLNRRGKPFAFVTGYGQQGVLSAYADAPLISKPFSKDMISDVLELFRQT